jgi:phosphate starvation-inducible PhoH-like protein
MEKIVSLEGFPNISLLFGSYNHNLKLMKEAFNVKIIGRENLKVYGDEANVEKIPMVVDAIKECIERKGGITQPEVEEIITSFVQERVQESGDGNRRFLVQPRTDGQRNYMEAIRSHEIVFAIGPAGTGKTYLAVAMAIETLKRGKVRRIVLVRPAVEAGERLGFLPGSFEEKINPYLRPLYDALHDLLEYNTLKKYMEKDIIEIAPLAYMRGRTLESSFIILDEAQNTTGLQMKMFLTRIGICSRVVITGDITQVDLCKDERSGLIQAQTILHETEGVRFFYLTRQDIVRHPLVQKIVEAYEKNEKII